MGRLAHYDITKFSDKRPFMRLHEIATFLQRKGFCLMKGELDAVLREKAIAEAEALKKSGGFIRPPKEVLCGMFGTSGSAWTTDLKEETDVPQSQQSLYEISKALETQGMDLATATSAYFDMKIQGRTCAKVHRSKSSEDAANPPLVDPDQAEFYMSLFTLKRLKLIYYLGPSLGNLLMVPIEAESLASVEVFSAQIQPGTMLIMRADTCRAFLDTRASDLGVAVEIDFIAATNSADIVPPPPELDMWFFDRYQAIVENDVTENVPEDWQKSARQCFHKSTPIRIVSMNSELPTVKLPGDELCPFEASVLGGNDCIGAIPSFKWDIDAYYHEDPEMTDDFKMYTKHMGFLDRGHPPEEDFDIEDFGLTKAEAESIDRRHLMLCESSCLCLQSAGMSKEDTEGEDFGVFCGLSGSDMYFALMTKEQKMSKCSVVGTAGIVNRISYMFSSVGPSLAVDTEDSSGSAAADTAVTYLRSGKCGSQALLGAANYIPHPFSIIILCASGLIGKTGRSRVFDESCDGYVRSEGVVTFLLELHKRDEESPTFKALFTGSAVNSKGVSSSLTAPSSAAIADILNRAQKDSGCPAAVLDAVEVHAAGNPIADAMEYGKMKSVLVSKEEKPSTVVLRNACSTLGSVGAPGGLVSIARAVLQFDKAVHGPCIHLHQLFEIGATAAEDYAGSGRLHINVEAMPARFPTSVVGVTSFGGSGTNVHHVISGMQTMPEAKDKIGKKLAYFPSNQKLPETTAPEVGYFIVGTWTAYEKPTKMEVESDGVYGYTVTLGENGWESFVIWVDGDKSKVLYPEVPWSPKDTKVCGPLPKGRENVWQIDGRCEKVIYANEVQMKALKEKREAAVKAGKLPEEPDLKVMLGFAGDYKPPGFEEVKDASDMPVVEVRPEDEGAPGDKYRVRLYTQGNFTRLSWVKLAKDSDLAKQDEETFTHTYYVTGDHNYFTFDPMSGEGTMSAEVHCLVENSTFQIVRDKDWDQGFYPKYPELTAGKSGSTGKEIEGPSAEGLLKKWKLPNKVGDIYKISFTRSPNRSISWSFVKNVKPDFEDLAKAHTYWLNGSYSNMRGPIKMDYIEADKQWKATFTAVTGKDTFFIMLNKGWLSTVHPADNEAHMGAVCGPDDQGCQKFWKLDKSKDGTRPGDEVEVTLSMAGGLPKSISWKKVTEKKDEFAG